LAEPALDLLDAMSAADVIAETQARRRREREAWAVSSRPATRTEPTVATAILR